MNTTTKKEKIKLVKIGERIGVMFFTGTIRADLLLEYCEYPTYEPWKGVIDGYQREQKRVNIDGVSDRTLNNPNGLQDFDSFVDNININVREPGLINLYVSPLKKEEHIDGDFFIFEYVPSILKNPGLWTVDGQTRVRGLAKARAIAQAEKNQAAVNEINSKMIGINITFTDDVYKECFCFYLLNHYSTNIPPDGALRMMYDGYLNGKIQFQNEITSGSTRMSILDIQAMGITEDLQNNSAIWADGISDFNENKSGKVSIRAMTNIIKPLLNKVDEELKAKGGHKSAIKLTYDIFEAYWKALKMWSPQMFDLKTRRDYGIMKSSLAEVMTKVLIHIFIDREPWEKLLGKTIGDLTKPTSYVSLIKVAFSKNKLKQTNGAGSPVSGPDCWRVSKAGAFGIYTSAAAKRELAALLIKNIKVELGITI